MADPEILDAEESGNIESLVSAVQRALPGRAVKVDVDPRGAFRVECAGDNGPILVESGPLLTATVSFRSARFTFTLFNGFDKAKRDIVDKVRALAADEIVVFEEQRAARVLRTVTLRCEGEKLVEVLEGGIVPKSGEMSGPTLSSFSGAFTGAPTTEQMRVIDKLTGGVLGKLKRRVAERVLSGVANRLARNFERVAADQSASTIDVDDGRRKLGE
jgi:hypothetical protein